ncbi:hypothetical protein KUCAC02_003117, partial [Chaenocephalus aceratus]
GRVRTAWLRSERVGYYTCLPAVQTCLHWECGAHYEAQHTTTEGRRLQHLAAEGAAPPLLHPHPAVPPCSSSGSVSGELSGSEETYQ